MEIKIDDALVHATVKLNSWLSAFVLAVIFGVSIFVLTYIALDITPEGQKSLLGLLGVFLPGYSVSPVGAWIGLIWGLVIGAIAGLVIYRIYAKTIHAQVMEYLNTSQMDEASLGKVSLRIKGNALGIAIGALFALGIFISTNWLILRGTAAQSHHAVLLANYLPGYGVTFIGSIVGAIEIFIIMYVFCQVFSLIYNGIVNCRHGRAKA